MLTFCIPALSQAHKTFGVAQQFGPSWCSRNSTRLLLDCFRSLFVSLGDVKIHLKNSMTRHQEKKYTKSRCRDPGVFAVRQSQIHLFGDFWGGNWSGICWKVKVMSCVERKKNRKKLLWRHLVAFWSQTSTLKWGEPLHFQARLFS